MDDGWVEYQFAEEVETHIQEMFEHWDMLFQEGGWPSDKALELVASVDLLYEYKHHIMETWED